MLIHYIYIQMYIFLNFRNAMNATSRNVSQKQFRLNSSSMTLICTVKRNSFKYIKRSFYLEVYNFNKLYSDYDNMNF